MLVEAGADPTVCNANGEPPLFSAIQGRSLQVVQWYLREGGPLQLEHRATFGATTPLIQCGLFGAEEIGVWLLSRGADVLAINGGGAASLHDATLSNSIRLVAALLDAGASINLQMRPRMCLFRLLFRTMRLLWWLGVRAEFVQVFGQTEGCSPLMWAALFGRPSVARLLLERGANPSLRNRNGLSAVDIAQARGFTETARVIESFEAKSSIEGRTPTVGEYPLHLGFAQGALAEQRRARLHAGPRSMQALFSRLKPMSWRAPASQLSSCRQPPSERSGGRGGQPTASDTASSGPRLV